MSLLEETKSLLRTYRSLPKKSLGQNFIVEPSVYQLMIEYSKLNQQDTVLDIGAGLGFLTQSMAERCKAVLAVEADRTLAGILREQLSGLHNVRVIEGSVLKVEIQDFDRTVSAPPYNISSRLIPWMLNRDFIQAVLIFQKEFANRLVAKIGSEDYGWLTVLTQYHGEVDLLDDVPRSSFYPQPEVDSTITRLVPKRPRLLSPKVAREFKQFVQSLFTQRNRKVKGAILPYLRTTRHASKMEAIRLAESLPYSGRRVRELAPEEFGVLANAVRC